MYYETSEGLCVVVRHGGCRLQQFVARNFREHLGRQSGCLHVNVRQYAADACQLGFVLVDGQVSPGRRLLQGGEIVMLKRTLPGISADEVPGPPGKARRGIPRMLVHQNGEIPESQMDGSRDGYVHFRRYYRDIQLLLAMEDWEQCEKLFFTPVPLSLRMNKTSMYHQTLQTLNETFGLRAQTVQWMELFGGAMYVTPTPCPSEASEGLQVVNMLASTGEVVVQDGLSMLAAAALDVQPGHAVLDLCSAPGSKTCQLLDALQVDSLGNTSVTSNSLLVANDLLEERSERVWARTNTVNGSNSKALMVTTMDGQFFPQILQDGFDRILVDVPCSSDGTMRKEPKVLHRWKVLNGLNHHGLQVSLLSRGIELLKPGGRLIYSTCSLNPMECEAVVQTALLRFGPQLSLLPLEEVLPLGSPRGAQGLEDWYVPDLSFESSGLVFHSWDEVEAKRSRSLEGSGSSEALQKSMFPEPTSTMQSLALHRCARFLPIHGENFGGFFLAALTKVAEAPRIEAFPRSAFLTANFTSFREEMPDALKEEIFRLFGVSDHHFQHLVAAPGGTVCELNPRFREMASTETLRILHCGLPLVHRMRHGGWKICPEGAQRLATMATKRKHMVHGEEILSLLLHRTLPLNQSDGPYLLQVDVNSHGFWLSGDVVNGHLSLETPEDVLQRLRLCVLKTRG